MSEAKDSHYHLSEVLDRLFSRDPPNSTMWRTGGSYQGLHVSLRLIKRNKVDIEFL